MHSDTFDYEYSYNYIGKQISPQTMTGQGEHLEPGEQDQRINNPDNQLLSVHLTQRELLERG